MVAVPTWTLGRGALVVLLGACTHARVAPAPAPPPPAPHVAAASYQLRDAATPLLHYLDEAPRLDAPARLRRFHELVIDANPDLFTTGVLQRKVDTAAELDARLVTYLPTLDARAGGIRNLVGQIRGVLTQQDASFRRAFPDMSWTGTVAFTASLDSFDGATRKVGGQTILLFGVDKMVKIYGEHARIGPLFHHELFHCYQQDVNPTLGSSVDNHGVLEPLWSEGLAVYVASKLNTDATAVELTLLDPMTAEVDARVGPLADELRSKLDSIDDDGYRDFFLGSGARTDVPIRAAYLIGFRVAQRVAARTGASLAALARLQRAELRPLVDAALAAMASEWYAAHPRTR